jgi:hypothetical protein
MSEFVNAVIGSQIFALLTRRMVVACCYSLIEVSGSKFPVEVSGRSPEHVLGNI